MQHGEMAPVGTQSAEDAIMRSPYPVWFFLAPLWPIVATGAVLLGIWALN